MWLLRTFVKCWQSSNRTEITNFFHISFGVDRFYTYASPCFWCAVLLLQHFVEDLSDHFFRRFVACLDVFGPDSVVVTCFTFFLRPFMAACTSSCVNSGISFLTSSLQLFFSVCLLWNSPKTFAIPVLDVTVSPLSFTQIACYCCICVFTQILDLLWCLHLRPS